MTVRPRGNGFEAAVCVRGKRLRRSFPNKTEAETWDLETRAALLKGEAVDLPTARRAKDARTMADLLEATHDRYWRGARSEDTSRTNAEHVVDILGPATLPRDVTEADLDTMIQTFVKRGLSNATINRKLAAFSRMMRFARSRGWIDRVPHIERFREPMGRIRWLTREEEAKVLDWFYQARRDEMRDLVIVLVDTGLRLGEALHLTQGDVDLQSRLIRVWENKSDKPRSVPMTSRVESVFRKRLGCPKPWTLTIHQAEHYWRQMRELCGFADDSQFVLHALRHTCASRLVQAGIGLQVVMEWLGHKSMSMTMRYAHLAPKNLLLAVKALDTQVKESA